MEKVLCLGCMQEKEQRPVCEHCGFDERTGNHPHQLPVGTILQNQYLIGRVLGQGGFGITYAGWDNLLMVPVAIKEYYPSGTVIRDSRHSTEVTCSGEKTQTYSAHKERFLQEARILAQVSGLPEIVQIKNHFHCNNTAYTVMEYVRGITLKEYLRRNGRPLTVEQTLTVMKPVIAALDKVHKLGLVHRDISPDNIMLQDDGTVKLIDFGTARYVENADVDNPLSKSTESILKHGFAPMEQYQSRGTLGPWTDVYALCCTIYYCMTGKIMLDAPTRVSEDEDLNLQSKIPGLSAAQAAALEKGLAVRAKDRIRSLGELHSLLYPAKIPDPPKAPKVPKNPKPPQTPQPPREPKQPKEPKPPRKPLPKFLMPLLALILCAAGIFAFLPKDTAPSQPAIFSPVSSSTHGTGADSQSPAKEAPSAEDHAVPRPAPASEITLWTYPYGNWGNEAAVTPLLAEFEADTGIRVHVRYLDYVSGDSIVNDAIKNGEMPDLILESPDRIVTAWGKYMVNIDDMFDAEDRAQIYPGALAACYADENTACGYPVVMTVHCMAINKTVFQAAGAMQYIDENTHTWTTEEFRSAMDAVFRYTGVPAGSIYCAGQGGDQGTRALFSNLMGGSFVNPELTAYTWDSPEMIAAMKLLHDMPSVQYNPNIAGGDEIALFYNGNLNAAFCWNIAQQLNPNSAGTGAGKTRNGDEILFMAFPAPEGVTPQLQGLVGCFGIFDQGDPSREEAARIFLRYFCDSEATADAALLANYFPVRTAAEGHNLTNVWSHNPTMMEYAKILPLMGAHISRVPNWSNARMLWWKMLQDLDEAHGNETAITSIAQNYTRQANGQ